MGGGLRREMGVASFRRSPTLLTDGHLMKLCVLFLLLGCYIAQMTANIWLMTTGDGMPKRMTSIYGFEICVTLHPTQGQYIILGQNT